MRFPWKVRVTEMIFSFSFPNLLFVSRKKRSHNFKCKLLNDIDSYAILLFIWLFENFMSVFSSFLCLPYFLWNEEMTRIYLPIMYQAKWPLHKATLIFTHYWTCDFVDFNSLIFGLFFGLSRVWNFFPPTSIISNLFRFFI